MEGGRAKGRDEGHGRRLREEGARAVMQLGTNLCCFFRFSVNRLVFVRTGVRREC